jgi:hypothetical protein
LEVIRVNKTTLTVPAFIAAATRRVIRAAESHLPWTDRLPYDKVQGRRSAAEIAHLAEGPERQPS